MQVPRGGTPGCGQQMFNFIRLERSVFQNACDTASPEAVDETVASSDSPILEVAIAVVSRYQFNLRKILTTFHGLICHLMSSFE